MIVLGHLSTGACKGKKMFVAMRSGNFFLKKEKLSKTDTENSTQQNSVKSETLSKRWGFELG